MNSFLRDVISKLINAEFQGHTSFKVADHKAVGDNPVRELHLDAVPVNDDQSIISLAWDGGNKLFEKTLPSEEAKHNFELISSDMSEAVSLTSNGKIDEAKKLMESLVNKYSEQSGELVPTNLPPVTTTQANLKEAAKDHMCDKCGENVGSKVVDEAYDYLCSKCREELKEQTGYEIDLAKKSDQDSNIWKQAKITMQNLFFSNTDELMEFQKKMKELQPQSEADKIPLWDAMSKGETAPEGEEKDTLAPPSLSYDQIEKEKAKETKNLDKRIKEQVKTELESSLEQKKATLFGEKDEKLIEGMRAVGRTWDEIKKYMVKELSYDKESVDMYIDELRAKEEGIHEEKPLPEAPKPPENLVSPETHDKLLEDLDKPVDEKKSEPPVKEEKEPRLSPKDIMDIPEEKESSKKCPKCGEDVWDTSTVDQRLNKCWNCGIRFDNPEKESSLEDYPVDPKWGQDHPVSPWKCSCGETLKTKNQGLAHFRKHHGKEKESSLDNEIARADNAEIRKVALKLWQSSSNYSGDDYSDYYVGPVKGYDADALAKSNYDTALQMLGGEGNGVLDAHFKSWAGDFDVILVHKDAKNKVAILQNIESKMANYPVLDEEDFSEREWKEQEESYDSWARENALEILDEELHRQNPNLQGSVSELDLSDVEHLLARVVMETLSYGDGTGLSSKHLINEAETDGLLKSLRDKLEGKEVVPEDSRQQKLFESKLKKLFIKRAMQKQALNPLQEPPVVEQPTAETSNQDIVPISQTPDHDTPAKGDRVFVMSDLGDEKAGFEGTYVSEYTSKGNQYAIIETDEKDLLDVEMHRVSKVSENTSPEPSIEPNVQKPEEPDIEVTPKMEDLHSSLKEATGGKCAGCGKDLPAVWGKTFCKECVDKAEAKGESPLKREELYNKSSLEGIKAEVKKLEAQLKEVEAESVMDTKCEDCGKPLGAEVFLSKHPVCGECTKKKHKKLTQHGTEKQAWTSEKPYEVQSENARSNMFFATKVEANNYAKELRSNGHDAKVIDHHDIEPDASLKTAADPEPVKTEFKELKKAPDFVDPKSAVPASPDMEQVLVKMESLQNKLSVLDQAKEKIKMAMDAELKKIDVGGERSQIEKELQDSYDKLGILIDATESKVINWSDQLYTLQHQEKEIVPKPTTGELLAKIYAKFDGAEKYVESVLNGFKALAKKFETKRLVKWPKRSSLEPVQKEASIVDELDQFNQQMLEALNLLSEPLA